MNRFNNSGRQATAGIGPRPSLYLLCAVALALPRAAGAATEFDCLIEPAQVVEVRSAVDGIIGLVNVRRGDPVRRGQALVELQSAVERAAVDVARFRSKMTGAVESARHRLAYATIKLERQAKLQSESFVSAQARDEAEAERRLAQAELAAADENQELARVELRRAEEQLAQRVMVAPFSGVVLDRMLNPGDLAEAGAGRKPVLRIAQIDPLKVDIVVPASLFGAIKLGQRASVSARSVQGHHVAAVTMVDKAIDPASATFVVRVDLPNPSHSIPSGTRCSAQLDGIAQPAMPRPLHRPAP